MRPAGLMRPPAAVLFDLYDTLVHASADNAFYRAVPAALRVRPDRWRACYRALGPASMRGEVPDLTSRVYLACHHAGQPRDRPTVATVVDGLLPLLYAGIRPDPEAVPVLDELRAHGVRLAIVSNAARHSGHLLDAFGFRDRIDATVMSWSTGLLKPDPRIYRVALDALATDPAQAAFVGDGRDHELQGARQLGLRAVLIERDLPHTESARAEASLCCASLAEAARALLAR
jgi:putative hydrolase of the HAD superfamily